MAYTITDLAACLDKLPSKDRDFANDLVTKGRKYGTSEKQAFWVDKLTKRAKGEDAPPAAVQVGDLTAAIALFDKAKQHLKYPKVVIQAGDVIAKLSVAGDNAKQPGAINVTSRDGSYGDRLWYGRITKDGAFHPGKDAGRIPNLVEYLKAFAKEPATIAAAYGKLTGHCAFCLRKLDDERSVAVGYGPICAKRWDLAWGDKRHSFKSEVQS